MNAFKLLGDKAELLMVGFAIGVLLVLFTPIPASLLDVLLIINFSWALMMLLLTFYIDKPLGFSTFPSLLLITTLFRLSLNISATRLILSDASAGKVISAMGNYVIQGNYVMGLVVFLILIIVQYIVVTNGAQRVAEVAARFTLDSMPGKQMSIDADLNMGIISQEEAKSRRAEIEKEANFYGAMDGASKFVKGDAIAGILIILVDIIGGFAIGLVQKGMSWSDSIHTYTLLTVGDGLVTQIPALIISTATGIIVTRAATDAQLGTEVAKQIAAHPKSLIMVCLGLVGMLCLHGMPGMPVLLILSLFVLATWYVLTKKDTEPDDESLGEGEQEESLYQQMKVHPLAIHFSEKLYSQFKPFENDLLEKIKTLRKSTAMELGLILPSVKLKKDSQLNDDFYQITIHGSPQGHGKLLCDRQLAINATRSKVQLSGLEVRDPTYGLPSVWIDDSQLSQAQNAGFTIIPAVTVLITHLSEVLRHHSADLLSRSETEKLLRQEYLKSMSEELIPQLLSLSQVQKILTNLLQEKISIRELETILEILLEHAANQKDIAELTEIVRGELANTVCKPLLDENNGLSVLTIAPQIEQQLSQGLANQQLVLEPSLTEKVVTSLAGFVEKMLKDNKRPVLLCSPLLRRHMRHLTARVIPHLNVISMNEIPMNIHIEAYGVIE